MVAGVIFDIDGTLLDSVDLHAEAWDEALRHFGHEVPRDRIRAQIGKGSDQLLPALLPAEVAERQGEEIDAYRSTIFHARYIDRIRAFPCVRELFQRLAADGLKLSLASSAKPEDLDKYIEIADIGDLIVAATDSGDAERSKPEPDIFEAAFRRLEPVPRSSIFVVGDTPYDAEAAARTGLRSIGLLCGGWPAQALRDAGCVAVYKDPTDLLYRYYHSPLIER